MHIYTLAKKCFLSALLLTGTSFMASAQKYTFVDGQNAQEIAKNHEEIAVHIKIRNNTLDTVSITWEMLSNTFTSGQWDMVALCDPYLCHNNIPSTFSPSLFPNATADSVSEFKLLATPKPNASTAAMVIKVWETANPFNQDTIILAIDARALGLENCFAGNYKPTLSAYPNPTEKILNFDIETFSNNKVEIYTLNGQKLLSANLTGATKSVNIERLPSGLYVARLQDKNGNVKISKFTKQ